MVSSTRQSARIQQAAPPKPRTSTRRTRKSAHTLTQSDCSTDQVKPPRRSTRITPSELLRRESALELSEAQCSLRASDLDARSASLAKKEEQVDAILNDSAVREGKAILSLLEDHFTCPLCYEIMAAPYSLNPGACGHSFCSGCILKHFFSRLHKACGGWHESVDCPICRALLVITPDRVPRLDITFPFVPNRTASTVCESLVNKLASSTSDFSTPSPQIKREPSEATWPATDDLDASCQWGKKSGKSKEEEEMAMQVDDEAGSDEALLAGWREGGNLRTEWIRKHREGKHEMANLLQVWTTLQPKDFIELKHKYGV